MEKLFLVNEERNFFKNEFDSVKAMLENRINASKKDSKRDEKKDFIDIVFKKPAERNQWLTYKTIRNAITHASNCIEVDKKIYNEFRRDVKKVRNDNSAYKICRKYEDVCKAFANSNVVEIVEKMLANDYSNIPIIENEKIVGVFNSKTLLTFFKRKPGLRNIDRLLIKDLKGCYKVNTDKKKIVGYIGKNESIDEVANKFALKEDENQKIELLFVTENGERNEQLLGIISKEELYNELYS